MALSLPGNPDLERFRRDARRLQRGVRDRDPQALELVARHHPGSVPDELDGFALTDAQLVLARSYGFASWPRLRDYLRRSAGLRRDPTTIDDTECSTTPSCSTTPRLDGAGRPERAAWTKDAWHGRRSHSPACATTAPTTRPAGPGPPSSCGGIRSLPGRDVLRGRGRRPTPPACAPTSQADPGAAVRSGGPFDWPPLLYLAYSRVPQQDPRGQRAPAARRRRRPRQRLSLAGGAPAVHGPHGRLRRGRVGPRSTAASPRLARPRPRSSSSGGPTPTTGRPSTTGCSGATTATSSCCSTTGSGTPRARCGPSALGVAGRVARGDDAAPAPLGRPPRILLLAQPCSRSARISPTHPRSPAQVRRSVSMRLRDGRTALHQAAFMGDLELIRRPPRVGADPTVVDAQHGTTPASWASGRATSEAEQLLRHGRGRAFARCPPARHTAAATAGRANV